MQKYITRSSSNAFEIFNEKLHSDDDIACDFLHNFCFESKQNDLIFKCIDVFINLIFLFLNVIYNLRILLANFEKSVACKISHVSVDTTNKVRCENKSNIFIIIVHDVIENTTAFQFIDQTQNSILREKNKCKKFFSIMRFVCDEIQTSNDFAFQCSICNRDVARSFHNRLMNFNQQKAFCENHRKKKQKKMNRM